MQLTVLLAMVRFVFQQMIPLVIGGLGAGEKLLIISVVLMSILRIVVLVLVIFLIYRWWKKKKDKSQ